MIGHCRGRSRARQGEAAFYNRAMARLVAGLVVTVLGAPVPAAAPPPRLRAVVEDLGIPRTDRAVQARAVLGDLLLATVFETKGAARLVVVDLPTGAQQEFPLPGSTGADALVVDEEHGVAWIGTSLAPAVWRFDAATRRAEKVAALDPFLARERYVWSLAVGPEGRLYAGTYPGGQLLLHDPARGVSKGLGPPLPGRQYVRDLLVGPSGTVYCGLGTPAAIVAYDPSTGGTTDLGRTAKVTFAYGLRLEAGQLYSNLEPVPVRESAPAVAPAAPATIRIEPDGRYEVARAARLFAGRIDLAPKQEGMGTMGLAAGPDGAVYGATYYNASLFRVDPATGDITSLGRVPEADGEFRVMQDIGRGRLLLPGYTAAMFLYEPGRPWGADNPRRLGSLGRRQHLATAIDRDPRGLVAIATPPDSGARGGALSLFDPDSLTWRTFTSLVADQSMTAVCFGPLGRLYGGSSVEVGLGEIVRARAARLVAVDVATGRTVANVVPVPQATAITALVALDERRVLGGTDSGHLFVYNARTGRSRVIPGMPPVRGLAWWRRHGVVLGIGSRRGLFTVDPQTLAVSWIAGSPSQLLPGLAFDASDRVYVHDGTRVLRVSVTAAGLGSAQQ
jgi:streptogramin lyase